MSAAAIQVLPQPLSGAAMRPADFPEGLFRVPVGLVLDLSTSSHVQLIRRRLAANDQPEATATVFVHGKRPFAVVDWPQARHVSSLFALDLCTWELRPAFGRRVHP